MVIRRILTGDPGGLTQLAEAVGPELSLACSHARALSAADEFACRASRW